MTWAPKGRDTHQLPKLPTLTLCTISNSEKEAGSAFFFFMSPNTRHKRVEGRKFKISKSCHCGKHDGFVELSSTGCYSGQGLNKIQRGTDHSCEELKPSTAIVNTNRLFGANRHSPAPGVTPSPTY